jgi:hypothetical protein
MINLKKHLLAAALALGVLNASATVLFTENFNYTIGSELNAQGSWVTYGTNSNGPITIGSQSLTLDGYQSTSIGGAASFTNATNSGDQDLHACFGEAYTEAGISSGSIYMSALVNISELPKIDSDNTSAHNFFLAFDGRTKSNAIAATKNTNNYWRLFVKATDNNKFVFGLSKNKAAPSVVTETEYDLNTTYLVVLKYTFVEGKDNDVLALYVNTVGTTEPSEPTIKTDAGTDATTIANTNASDYGIGGVALMQNGTAGRTCPKLTLDALRVATTWAELFNEEEGDTDPLPAGDPTISFGKDTQASYDFKAYVNVPVTLALNIKGENLTGDIQVAHTNATDFTLDATSIDKTKAMQGNGVVNLTFVSSVAGEYTDKITFANGSQTLTIDVKATATTEGLTLLANARAIQAVSKPSEEALYQYTGTATVTFIDTTAKRFYAQDASDGMCVDYQYLDAVPCAVGDKITALTGSLEQLQGLNYFVAGLAPTIVSSNNEFSATEVTLEVMDSDSSTSIFRLIKVKDVTLTPNESGKYAAGSSITLTQGEYTGSLSVLAGTDLVGADIPTTPVDVTGISRSIADFIISPRSLEDVVAPASLEATITYAREGTELVAKGSSAEVVKFKVEAKNLPNAIDLEVTGNGRAMYSVSPTRIEKGTSTTEVVVTYSPTAVGKHNGVLYFDEYYSRSFTFAAYDPDNMPSLTVDDSNLVQFEAAPGSTHEQTITVTTANLVDYGASKFTGDISGAFLLKSGSTLLKTGTANVTISFAPKAEGTYTQQLEISGLGAETKVITLTGVCSGEATPDETEGDSFDLDVKNPLPLLNEGFDSVQKNKVISLTGWTNVANQGSRAWWGYEFSDDDNNKAAKVTAYDSKIASGAGEACQMTLVTPALDYVNAGSKLLTFRVMGQNLTDDMTDKFEVLYMDLADGELYTQSLNSSMDLPDTEDESGEWMDYLVDFSDVECADTFFIGFRFTSTRGVDNSAIYYVDDVSWGRTDIPQIKPAKTEYSEFAFVNSDFKMKVTVNALNLTGNITMKMEGDNPSKFSLDKTTLPAEGGDVTVTFNSDQQGVHSAYLTLQADGAATAYVYFEIKNITEDGDGVSTITADANGEYKVYNMLGVKILTTTDASELTKLSKGIYIVNGKKLVIK